MVQHELATGKAVSQERRCLMSSNSDRELNEADKSISKTITSLNDPSNSVADCDRVYHILIQADSSTSNPIMSLTDPSKLLIKTSWTLDHILTSKV